VCSPVCAVSAHGVYDVQYHLVIACRDGSIYVLGNNMCKQIVQLETLPLNVIAESKSLRVATMDNRISHYSLEVLLDFKIQDVIVILDNHF
jgi:hypothetical protein